MSPGHSAVWLVYGLVLFTRVPHAAPEAVLDGDFDAVCRSAFALAQGAYQTPVSVDLPAFDAPGDGNKGGLGLVYEEYLKITARQPVFDDGTLWVRSRPRGGVERFPLELWSTPEVGAAYRSRPYRAADFDYSSPVIAPPLPTPVPAAAGVLTALEIGRRLAESKRWPQVMYLGGNAYGRLSGLTSVFGSSLRLAAFAVGGEEVKPRLTQIYVKALPDARLALFGVIESAPFNGCVQALVTPGLASRMQVSLKFYPRPGAAIAPAARVSPLAISSMFWKGEAATPADPADEAHDADRFLVCGQGAVGIEGLVPATHESPDQFRRFGAAPCFGLMQLDRESAHYGAYAIAGYARRASFWVDELQSDQPFSINLYTHGTTYEGEDNVVAYVAFRDALPPAPTAADGARFSYTLTATLAPPPMGAEVAPVPAAETLPRPASILMSAAARRADLVLDFGSAGLWQWLNDTQWSQLSDTASDGLALGDLDGDAVADLVVDRGPAGLQRWRNQGAGDAFEPRPARQLLSGDLDGDGRAEVLADFGAGGLAVRKPNTGWDLIPAPPGGVPPTNLALGDLDGDQQADLVADVGPAGLWALLHQLNETVWVKLHSAATQGLLIADIDGDGLGNLVANRGADGVWISRDQRWERLHPGSPKHMAAGDLDGNGRLDLAFDLGGDGLWLWMNDGAWSRVDTMPADLMLTVDLDGNGADDLLLSQGAAGTNVWMNNQTWRHLHDRPARHAVAGHRDEQ